MAEAFAHLESFGSLDSKDECPICLDVIKKPKLLDCSHCFCEDCIRDWRDKSRDKCGGSSKPIHCPSCWQSVTVGLASLKCMEGRGSDSDELPGEVVASEKRNGDFIYLQNKTIESTEGTFDDKNKTAASGDNTTVENEHSQPPPNKTIKHLCLNHNKELRFFCETCKESICRQCVVAKHLSGGRHRVFDIDTAAEKADGMFKASIEKQKCNADKIDKEIDKLISCMDRVEKEYKCVMTDIERVFNELDRASKQKIKSLKGQASAIRKERNEKIEERLKCMIERKSSEVDLKEVCENAMESGKAFDKVELASSIGEYCAGVRFNNIDVLPKDLNDSRPMWFGRNTAALKRIEEGLQKIGKIHFRKSDPCRRCEVVESVMSNEMEQFATFLIWTACTQRNPVENCAESITNKMDKKYGCTWCCFIGSRSRSDHVPLNFKLVVRIDDMYDVVLFKIPSVTDEGMTLTEYAVQKASSNNMSSSMILDAIDLVYTACRSGKETRNELSSFISTEFNRLHGSGWSCLIIGGSYYWSCIPSMYVTLIMGQEYFILWRS